MQPILLHLLAATLYGVLGALFWRAQSADAPPRAPGMSTRERLLLLGALCAQGLALHLAMFAGDGMRFGFGLAVSLMLWLAVAFYWIETFYARLDGLHGLVLPAGVIGSVLPLVFPGQHLLANAASPAFRAHFIVAMLAYSLFTLAALHAMLMAMAERQLHSGRLSRTVAALPPLLTMEALLFRLIGIAFILLTLTLGSGIYGSTFFMLTGFHGLHVTLGTIMLIVIWFRCLKGHFSRDDHFGFEAVAWYWHFVDVVWLGLFLFVYVL